MLTFDSEEATKMNPDRQRIDLIFNELLNCYEVAQRAVNERTSANRKMSEDILRKRVALFRSRLAAAFDELPCEVRAHVNRDISMDDKTGEALDEIIAAAVRRMDATK